MTRNFLIPTLIGALCASAFAEDSATTKGIIDLNKTDRPEDDVVLVGEKGYDMVPDGVGDCQWVFADGVLTASPKWDSLLTKDAYGDFRMHLEFSVNDNGDTKNLEANGNSGVYIQQRYELQIQNAFGISAEDFKPSYGGSIYKQKKPDLLASKKAGEWQTYNIAFRAARFEGDKKTEDARITVYHNGELIHDDYALTKQTGAGKKEGPEPGQIKLQGHHNPVKFRNVWIQPLKLD